MGNELIRSPPGNTHSNYLGVGAMNVNTVAFKSIGSHPVFTCVINDASKFFGMAIEAIVESNYVD